jgi:hypothetical protein
MFGGGFWGTPREDEWRRRKEKEYQRESAIHAQEEQRLKSIRSKHAQEMETHRQELLITKSLLHGARRTKRKRDNTEEGTGDEETSKPAAAQNTTQEESKEDMWKIRESLLALSYAMFDTLYDEPTFNSAPFVKFLLKQGEVALAEQIALCGLSKSNADGKDASFILEEFLPISDDPDHLIKKIKEELSGKAAEKSGNDALVNWLLSKGREDEAFSTILLHPDEKTNFLSAFPLATTPERRLQLAKKCPRFLSAKNIGCFPDGQWLSFIQFLNKRQNLAERLENESKYRGSWNIEPKEYLLYADKTRNATLGHDAVDRMLKSSRLPDILDPDGYSYLLRHKANTAAETVTYVRDLVAQQMRKELNQLQETVKTKEMQTALRALDINPLQCFAERMMKLFPIPTTTCCPTRHAEIRTAQSCATCRHTFNRFAAFLGAASVLRQELAPQLVRDYGLTWPLLREDDTWNLPVNKYTESGMAALFGTLMNRQLVCVGQPTPPPDQAVPVVAKTEE